MTWEQHQVCKVSIYFWVLEYFTSMSKEAPLICIKLTFFCFDFFTSLSWNFSFTSSPSPLNFSSCCIDFKNWAWISLNCLILKTKCHSRYHLLLQHIKVSYEELVKRQQQRAWFSYKTARYRRRCMIGTTGGNFLWYCKGVRPAPHREGKEESFFTQIHKVQG